MHTVVILVRVHSGNTSACYSGNTSVYVHTVVILVCVCAHSGNTSVCAHSGNTSVCVCTQW